MSMGIRNVSAVFAMWPDLPPTRKLLLIWMALVSLDNTSPAGRPARTYFDGEEALISASGMNRRNTYKALVDLREVGAIEPLERGRHGHRAVYRLNLDPLAEPVDNSAGDPSATPGSETSKGVAQDTLKGVAHDTSRVSHTTPLGTTKERRGGRTSSSSSTSPATTPPVDNQTTKSQPESTRVIPLRRTGTHGSAS